MANDDMITIPDGRIGHDLQVETSQRGTKYLRIRFASTPYHTNRQTGEKQQGETRWWNTTVFDLRLIETCLKDLHKGDSVRIEGVLDTSTYTDKNGVAQIDYRVLFPRISKNIKKAKPQAPQADQRLQQQTTASPYDYYDDNSNR